MKIWKNVCCIALLAVILFGCVMLGKNTLAAQEAVSDDRVPSEKKEQFGEDTEKENAPTEGSAVVEKRYSEGLAFRSNGDGTCALSGLGECTDACVLIPPKSPGGDTVIEILPGALSGSIVGAIELPATIQAVSAASFAGCERLAYIRVAEGNSVFSEYDGALYSADGRTLLFCPVGRSAKDLSLHRNLRRIAAGALADCPALVAIYFPGTTAEWQGIIVGDENNALYRAALTFDSSKSASNVS